MQNKQVRRAYKLTALLLIIFLMVSCSRSGDDPGTVNGDVTASELNSNGSGGGYYYPGITEPITLLIDFAATGTAAGFDPVTGESTYLVRADGFVPIIARNGVVSPNPYEPVGPLALLEGAMITFEYFDFSAPPPVVNFSCTGCNLTFKDGSVLEADPNVPLAGRVPFIFGPVNFDPASPTVQTVRMMGCSGLKETSGTGLLANMVGSICFNGVFDFDVSNPPASLAAITGASNCTITMHTPFNPGS